MAGSDISARPIAIASTVIAALVRRRFIGAGLMGILAIQYVGADAISLARQAFRTSLTARTSRCTANAIDTARACTLFIGCARRAIAHRFRSIGTRRACVGEDRVAARTAAKVARSVSRTI
jgi:hypothetical protein